MTDNKNNLRTKLQSIQHELKAPKGQWNKFASFNYRSCEDILEALKPLLVEYKVILTISDEIVNFGDRYYVKATTCLKDIEGDDDCVTVSGCAREQEVQKGMNEAQITGSASSYARKYALNGLFAIDDTKDADAQDNSKAPVKTPAPAKVDPLAAKKSLVKKLADELSKNKMTTAMQYKAFIKKETSLELVDKNYDEIINRLTALTKEK